jgi:sterol desaturase/sphingolipid hydroxylase (fatty acid hydroxylase superfamily)
MMLAMRWLVSITALPLMLAAALGGAIAAMERGVPPARLLLPIFAASALLVALLERWLPYRHEWNRRQGDLWTDAAYVPTTWIASGLLQPLVATLAVVIGGWLSGALDSQLWPTHWPLLGQLALACVVVELPSYWAHRWMHEVPWLWRLHAVHHSAPRLYWLNTTRSHPLEMAFRGLFSMLPLAIAGAGAELLALNGITNIVIGLFQHANVDIRLGPLNWVFSAAPVHRWHHSRALHEANSNYGDNFIFWDTIFGTRQMPEREPPVRLGIEGLDAFPRGYLAQLVAPFRWRRIQRASEGLDAGLREGLA